MTTVARAGSNEVGRDQLVVESHLLQQLLVELNESESIRRSTSVVILSTLVQPRAIPLLSSGRA